MPCYYNDNDPACCRWLRELIKAKLVPDGEVDERSIADVRSEDLRGFTQCHFFCGIAGWPYALRLAGWSTSRPVWTGSAPCQPFSSAGKRKGTADKRHLWPEFYRLVAECGPKVVFGEQVASSEVVGSQREAAFIVAVQRGDYARANKIAKQLVKSSSFHYWHRWLDGVFLDLERAGYACGATVLPVAGIGAPHIRHRIWWVAESASTRRDDTGQHECGWSSLSARSEQHGTDGRLADANGSDEHRRAPSGEQPIRDEVQELGGVADAQSGRGQIEQRESARESDVERRRADGGLADAESSRRSAGGAGLEFNTTRESVTGCGAVAGGLGNAEGTGAVPAEQRGQLRGVEQAGFWSAFDLIPCRDGKARRVERGAFPLVDGSALAVGQGSDLGQQDVAATTEARVMRLRGYGNAIVPELAAEFVKAYLGTVQ